MDEEKKNHKCESCGAMCSACDMDDHNPDTVCKCENNCSCEACSMKRSAQSN